MNITLYHYKVVVTDVYDGDTITADIDLGCGIWMMGRKVRLFGIDTPELRGESRDTGIRSRDYLTRMLLGARETIIQTVRDTTGKYGRLLGIMWVRHGADTWVNVNDNMVESGMAVRREY